MTLHYLEPEPMTPDPHDDVLTDVVAALGGALSSHSELLVAGLRKLEDETLRIRTASDQSKQDLEGVREDFIGLQRAMVLAYDALHTTVTTGLNASAQVMEAAIEQAAVATDPATMVAATAGDSSARLDRLETQVGSLADSIANLAEKLDFIVDQLS